MISPNEPRRLSCEQMHAMSVRSYLSSAAERFHDQVKRTAPHSVIVHAKQRKAPDSGRHISLYSVIETYLFEDEQYSGIEVIHHPLVWRSGEGCSYVECKTYGSKQAWFNRFQLTVDKRTRLATFGDLRLQIEPETFRGFGIGSFCMNRLVTWIQQYRFTDCRPIRSFQLADKDATSGNKDVRNQFYRHHGCVLVFPNDPTEGEGEALLETLGALEIHDVSDQIESFELESGLCRLIEAEASARNALGVAEHNSRQWRNRCRLLYRSGIRKNWVIVALGALLTIAAALLLD